MPVQVQIRLGSPQNSAHAPVRMIRQTIPDPNFSESATLVDTHLTDESPSDGNIREAAHARGRVIRAHVGVALFRHLTFKKFKNSL